MRKARRTLLLFLALPTFANGSTHVWQGPASGGHWNSAANWTNGKPTSGEIGGTILQFGSGIASIDDLSGLIVDQINFTGGGNSVSGTATIVLGEATSVNISNLAGSNSFGSGISFTIPTFLTYVNLPAGTVTINGNVTGTGGGFELVNPSPSGTGTLVLLGTDSWVGTTYIDNGTLSIDASTTNGGMPSDVYIGNGSGTANSAVLTEGSANNISDTANVNLSSDGRWNLAGNETIGRLNGTGGTVSLGSSILTVNPTGVSSFGGVITGTGVFRKLGNYTQVLSGNNTYSGGTDVTAGTLVVNGSQPAGAVNVQSGAYLFGSGTVGPLTVSGGASVSPGSSPPPSPNNGGPGILSVSGNLTLASGSTYFADVNGTTPGTGYDRIAATLTASINGANLQIYTGFTPTGGTTFTIVTANSVTGTFAGLPEGALVFSQNASEKYYIHYSATSVVLTACQNLTNVSVNLTSGSTTVCSGTGGTLSVADTGGGGNSHQWGYRTVSNGTITNIPGQTNATYPISVADFPGPGDYLVVCTSNPLCGSAMTSNEISVSIGDSTAPTVTPPTDAVVTQTVCN